MTSPELGPPVPQDPAPPRVPSFEQRFRESVEIDRQNQEKVALEAYGLELRSNPETAAEAQRVAREIGVDPATAERNLEVARAMAQKRQAAQQRLLDDRTVLGQFLRDREFARVAQKDTENLSFIERFSKGYESGQLQIERGEIGTRMFETAARGTSMSTQDAQRLAWLNKQLGDLGPPQGIGGNAGSMVGQMSVTLPRALATGVAVGSTAALVSLAAGPGAVIAAPEAFVIGMTAGTTARMVTQASVTAIGNNYLDLIGQGYQQNAAWWAALGGGLVEGGLEGVSFGVFTGPLKREALNAMRRGVAEAMIRPTIGDAGKKFAVSWAENIAAETGTEVAQTFSNIVAEDIASKFSPGTISTMTRGEVGEALIEAGTGAAQGMMLLGAFPPGVAMFRDAQRIAQAKRSEQEFAKLMDGAESSELRQHSPEKFERFFAEATKGTKVEEVYIDGRQFAEVLAQSDAEATGEGSRKTPSELLREKLPGVADAIQKASEAGADVVIPSSLYATHFVGTPLDQKLRPHVRTDPAAMSPAEAASTDIKEKVAEFEKAADARIKRDEQATEIEARVRDEIMASGVIRSQQARDTAALIRSYYETLSEDTGLDPNALPQISFKKDTPEAGAAAQPGDRGYLDVQRLVVLLTEKSDASTLIHEMFHAFDAIGDMLVGAGKAPQKLIDAKQTLLDWYGVKDFDTWKAMTTEEKRRHREALAVNGEKYLLTGVAPTQELQPVFDRFANWIRKVYEWIRGGMDALYRKEFGVELPALTPAVRAVFDAMLASRDAVVQADAVRQRTPAFQTRESFPGTDEQWAEYQQAEAARTNEAVGQLTGAVLKDLSWRDKEIAKITKAVAAEARELRKAAGEEAKGTVEERPVYRLRSWLKEKPKKAFAQSDIESIFGPEAKAVIGALEGHVAVDGWNPDVVAERFGYQTGEQMLRDLATAPSLATAIEQQTDEIMLRDHGDLRDAKSQATAVQAALDSEAASRLAASVYRFATNSAKSDRTTMAAVKEAARIRLANTPVRQISPRTFSLMAARAEKEAAEAFNGKRATKTKGGEVKAAKAPDPRAGIAAVKRQMLYLEMARQAARVQKEIDSALTRFDRFNQPDTKLAKTHNLDFVNVGRAILGGFGIGPASRLPLSNLDGLKQYSPTLFDQLAPLVTLATGGDTLQDYRNLTLTKFRELADTVDSLWHDAARERQIEVNGKLIEKASAKAEIMAQFAKTLGTPDAARPLLAADTKIHEFSSVLTRIYKVEHFLRMLDGGQNDGPAQRYLWRPLRKALDQYLLDRAVYVKKLEGIVQGLFDKGLLDGGKITLTDGAGVVMGAFDNTAHFLGALQHIGNASNKRKLLLGYGWAEEIDGFNGEKVLDTRRWDAALQKLHDSGRIKKAHLDALQAIGDINAELKPRAQAVNKEAYGRYFEEIEVAPITTPWGTFPGWYAPAKPDPMNPANTALDAAVNLDNPIASAERGMGLIAPSVGKGWTITRNQSTRPLLLDITHAASHFDEMLRFIHLQIPLRDVWSLLMDKEIRGTLEAFNPSIIRNFIKPMLDDTAMGRMSKPTGAGARVDRVLHFIKSSTSRAYMAFSLRNWLQQYTGLSNVLVYVPRPFVAAAFGKHHRMGGAGAQEFITSRSPAMRARFQEHLSNAMKNIDLALNPSHWTKVDRAAEKYSYCLLQLAQHKSDRIAWMAAYDHAVATGKDEATAIDVADSVVRLSQGSRTTMDTSVIERSNPLYQLLAQFNSYWINLFNTGWFNPNNRASAVAWGFLVPTFTGAAISAGLSLGTDFDDDDGDGYTDEVLWWLLATPVKGGGGMFPVVGPIVAQIATSEKKAGNIVSAAPVMAPIEATARSVKTLFEALFGDETAGSRDLSGAEIRDAALSLSFFTGIPMTVIGRAWGFAEDVADGKKEATTLPEWVMGLTGNVR